MITRIVDPLYKNPMGYKYRMRIEKRTRKTWLGMGKEVTEYRWALEEYFVEWTDCDSSFWSEDKKAIQQAAHNTLDSYDEEPPEHEYLECR